jgi:hypothetical protein
MTDDPTREKLELADEKFCNGCRTVKPLTEFRFGMRHGTRKPKSRCRECMKADERSPERRKVKYAYAKRPGGRDTPYHKRAMKARSKRWAKKYPEKDKTKALVRKAIRTGELVKPNRCEKCGDIPLPHKNGQSRIEGHHADYSKPLDVTWLCSPCHLKLHLAERNLISWQNPESPQRMGAT